VWEDANGGVCCSAHAADHGAFHTEYRGIRASLFSYQEDDFPLPAARHNAASQMEATASQWQK
jgi:hypothetical protein